MFCPKCGTKHDDSVRFCHNCGADLSEYLEQNNSVPVENVVSKTKSIKPAAKSNGGGSNSVIKVCMIIQALALTGYGLLACVLHHRMDDYDLFSIGQIGKPVHMMYSAVTIIGLCLVIYGIVTAKKQNRSLLNAELVVPAAAMLVAFINSGANKVYTATSGGSLLGFIRYGIGVGMSGEDPIDKFYYNNFAIVQYLLVALIGIAILVFTIIRITNNSKPVNAYPASMPLNGQTAVVSSAASEMPEQEYSEVVTIETDNHRETDDNSNEGF